MSWFLCVNLFPKQILGAKINFYFEEKGIIRILKIFHSRSQNWGVNMSIVENDIVSVW
jgi:hypothetical protein